MVLPIRGMDERKIVKIVTELRKEFRDRYKGGWFLLSSPVRGALLFKRAVQDAITQARIASTQVDPEYLDRIHKKIQEEE